MAHEVFSLDELELPIVQAPMAGGPSTPALAVAVSEAGGLGTVAAGYRTVDAVEADIAAVRAGTRAPFGVNLFAPPGPAGDPAALARFAERLDFLIRHPEENYALGWRPRGGEPILVSEWGNWGLSDPAAMRERLGGEPAWFEEDADNPTDRMKRVAGFEERFARLGLGDVGAEGTQLVLVGGTSSVDWARPTLERIRHLLFDDKAGLVPGPLQTTVAGPLRGMIGRRLDGLEQLLADPEFVYLAPTFVSAWGRKPAG